MLADWAYREGIVQQRVDYFDLSARLFPLNRNRRLAGVYGRMLIPGNATWGEVYSSVLWGLSIDPNSADIWLAKAQLDLKFGNKAAYTADMVGLRKLTPHIVPELPEGLP